MEFPTKEEISKASREQIGSWYRYLPSPSSGEEKEAIDLIVEIFTDGDCIPPEQQAMIGWIHLRGIDGLRRALDSYFCVWMSSPLRAAPYAMFASRDQADMFNKNMNAPFEVHTFKWWLENFEHRDGAVSLCDDNN